MFNSVWCLIIFICIHQMNYVFIHSFHLIAKIFIPIDNTAELFKGKENGKTIMRASIIYTLFY